MDANEGTTIILYQPSLATICCNHPLQLPAFLHHHVSKMAIHARRLCYCNGLRYSWRTNAPRYWSTLGQHHPGVYIDTSHPIPTTEPAPPPPTPPAKQPIIFLRPANVDAGEVLASWDDRGSGAPRDIGSWNAVNVVTPKLPFRPLGSLVCIDVWSHTVVCRVVACNITPHSHPPTLHTHTHTPHRPPTSFAMYERLLRIKPTTWLHLVPLVYLALLWTGSMCMTIRYVMCGPILQGCWVFLYSVVYSVVCCVC